MENRMETGSIVGFIRDVPLITDLNGTENGN